MTATNSGGLKVAAQAIHRSGRSVGNSISVENVFALGDVIKLKKVFSDSHTMPLWRMTKLVARRST